LGKLRELRRLRRIKAEREASRPLEERCPDPVDRAALIDPTTLAAHLDPAYRVRPHLRVIGVEMAALERGDFRRLMINTPPQCGKTRTTVEWGAFWWLVLHPGHHVVIGSYGDDLAVRRGEAIRRLVVLHGARFGLRLEHGSMSKKDWTLTTGGGVRSVGVGSSITGFAADALWVDDPTKSRQEADSAKYRKAVADWYSADLLTRRAPGAPVVLVQCIVASMRVLTGDGRWTNVEDVRAGDTVVSLAPNMTDLVTAKVSDARPSGYDSTVTVKTDRLTLQTNRGHPFAVLRRGQGRPNANDIEWVKAGDLTVGDLVVTAKALPDDYVANDQLPDGSDVDEQRAWLLGYLLGDGWVTAHKRKNQRGQPTSYAVCMARTKSKRPEKADLDERARALLEAWSSSRVYADRSGAWRTDWNAGGRVLTALGYGKGARGKRVPDCVWDWSVEARRAFIKGYVEADGSLSYTPTVRPGGETWTVGSVNEDLLRDIRDLSLTCGVRPAPVFRNKPYTNQPPHSPVPITTTLYTLRLTFSQDVAEGRGSIKRYDHPSPRHLRYERVTSVQQGPILSVYDLTVEGTGTFVAEGFVTHNTPWHPDDLRARVLAQEGRVEDGGRWRVVVMPALCTDPAGDPLGRQAGDPLPHPKVAEGDRDALLAHWAEARATSTARDWSALYQCDPKPAEGTLLRWDTLRERRCYAFGSPSAPCAQAQTVAVAVDPSGGGRDTAGIVAGYLGTDDRLYLTHDRSGVMPSEAWGRTACELAVEVDADRFVIEVNYGGDQATLVLRTAWEALRREDPARFGLLVPRIVAVRARRGKLLRAEPIAQQWVEDRVRTAAYLPELEQEWVSWVPGPDSPGRIDASVHLAYELLPVPQSGAPSAAGADLLTQANLLPWGR
jgi:terminase large subunit-like protein/LAGLIDADG DNA endonuclease family protein